jgi:hypothetical protein
VEDPVSPEKKVENRVAELEKKSEAQRHAKPVIVTGIVVGFLLVIGVGHLISQRTTSSLEQRVKKFIQIDPDAQPATAQCPSGTPTQKGQEAVTLVTYPWEQLDYRVEFLGPRSGYLAITNTGTKTISLYVRSCQSVNELAHTMAHEFGHAIDDRYNTEADRAQIQLYRGIIPARPWFGCSSCTDYATPAGDFAEVFAYMHSPPGRFRSQLNGPPGPPEQLAAMEQFFGG